MIIRHKSNPLRTVIELNDHDRTILRLKLEIEELENRVYGAYVCLEDGDASKALARLNVRGLEDEPLAKRLDIMMRYSLEALNEEHMGDCVCEPCSCSKCHAENLLGIDTIEGLGKHAANHIRSAFGDNRGIDEAIAWLTDYQPQPSPEWLRVASKEAFKLHVPRWRQEASEAADWLRDYRQKHFLRT